MGICFSSGDLSLEGKGQVDELEEERTDVEQQGAVGIDKGNLELKGGRITQLVE
jgi:hypothetical protein